MTRKLSETESTLSMWQQRLVALALTASETDRRGEDPTAACRQLRDAVNELLDQPGYVIRGAIWQLAITGAYLLLLSDCPSPTALLVELSNSGWGDER